MGATLQAHCIHFVLYFNIYIFCEKQPYVRRCALLLVCYELPPECGGIPLYYCEGEIDDYIVLIFVKTHVVVCKYSLGLVLLALFCLPSYCSSIPYRI